MALSAGKNLDVLAEQIKKFKPKMVSISDGADLARNERAYVEAYLRRLLAKGHSLAFADAWREYRLHALWALTALIISAGASADYFAEGPARLTISRAAAAVERVDARGALLDLID